MGQGAGVGVGAVDKTGYLGARLAEVNLHGVAAYGHPGPDGYQSIVKSVVVHQGLSLVDAVGPFRDELAYLALGGRQMSLTAANNRSSP